MCLWYSDSDRVGKRQYGGLPKRCVFLRNTAGDREFPILQWINIDEVSLQRINRKHFLLSGRNLSGRFGDQEMLWEIACNHTYNFFKSQTFIHTQVTNGGKVHKKACNHNHILKALEHPTDLPSPQPNHKSPAPSPPPGYKLCKII